MKAGIGLCSNKVVALAGLGVLTLYLAASAAPPQRAPVSDLYIKNKGAKLEGPVSDGLLWLDEATRARGGAASAGAAEAPIFDQPRDCVRGFFEKTYNDGPIWSHRMVFGNGFSPGSSFSSYEGVIFHSTSDDPAFGPADYRTMLWDGDPLSVFETVCTTGGTSAPIAGTEGIIADVPYGAVVRFRVELPAKVAYGCDRAWMSVESLNGCRAAWRLSGSAAGSCGDIAPVTGVGQGLEVLTGCESSTFGGACPTATGYGIGFCCGSAGTCSGSGDACGFGWKDCPAGETCDGAEDCDHGSADPFPDPCSTAAAAASTFCGTGNVAYFFGGIDPMFEDGMVGTVFAATDTTLSIVPVSVDAPPSAGGSGSGVVSLSGDTVVLQDGNHNVWFEVRIGDWDPSDSGVALAGNQAALNLSNSVSSGLQGTLTRNLGGITCGECSDDLSACGTDNDCTVGTCSGSGDPCHVALIDCPSGESCDGAAVCVPTATGNADCAAVLGVGSLCGPDGYVIDDVAGTRGTGTCGFAYVDDNRPDWVLEAATVALPALDVSSIDARLGGAVVVAPNANDPVPFPANGVYGGSFSLHAPSDCKGTFTIKLKAAPASSLTTSAGPPVPLLGTLPGFLECQTGRCCIGIENLATDPASVQCLDGTQTQATCDQIAADGGTVTLFTVDEVCPANGGPDCGCDPAIPSTFNDGDACTDDACIDGVPTSTPTDCSDGLVCTDDECDPSAGGGAPGANGCFNPATDVDDGLACTNDGCTEARGIFHDPVDVDDGIACTFDFCSEPSGAISHDDLSVVPNAYPCPTGDPVADGCPGASGTPQISTACTDGFCHCILCFTDVPCNDPLACRANIEIAWSATCAGAGEKVTADVVIGEAANGAAVPINGGQFVLNYDAGCMSLNGVDCAAPYSFEIFRSVSAGRIQLACGVDPFGGVNGPPSGSGAVLASASFDKLSNCDSCGAAFKSDNPNNTAYTDVAGQPICADITAVADVGGKSKIGLTVPDDVKTNADCEASTAIVTWAAPSASSSCGTPVDLACSGVHSSGTDMSALAMGGGEHPQGVTSYTCTATDTGCGGAVVTDGWTVTVNSDNSIDVTVQLSPVLAGELRRCIKFELFEDCTQPPTVIERDLFFGGLFDFVGHFTDTIKAPKGQYACITARDQLHSLRGCALLGAGACIDGVYEAVFKGDPFFGGNWLQNGNLDGWKKDNPSASHDVIDIFDFGQFMALFLTTPSIDTPCDTAPREVGHGDINGDGVVDALDLSFVTNNFLTSSKDCCCGAAAGVTVPRIEVSVRELREMGFGEMAVADLDKNGLVNTDDITAFMAGERPDKTGPVRGGKASGVRSR